jgi:hypothetical protein
MGEGKGCTEQDLIDAVLATIQGGGEQGMTGPEIARATHMNIHTVRERLANLKEQGSIEVVSLVRLSLIDTMQHVRGYRAKTGSLVDLK